MYRISLFILLLGVSAAQAEFARWTSKDGKTAELEFLKLETKGETETVSFRTRAGKTVTMNLTDLQEADRERARTAGTTPATTPFPVKGAGGALEVEFQKASGQPPRPKKDQDPGSPASIDFTFSVRCAEGSNFAYLKADSLEVEPFEVGGKKVPSKNWKVTQTSGTSISLSTTGNFDVTKLAGSKVSARVTALAGSTKKSERLELKVPKEESKPSSGKIGAYTLYLTRDPQLVKLSLDAKDRSKIISFYLEGATQNGGTTLDLLHVDKTVTVIVDYWEEIKEVPLKLEGTAS